MHPPLATQTDRQDLSTTTMHENEAAAFREEWVTLRDVATLLGRSYWAASSLAASGALGRPIVIGCTQFFSKELAERAVQSRIAERQAKGNTAPITPAA